MDIEDIQVNAFKKLAAEFHFFCIEFFTMSPGRKDTWRPWHERVRVHDVRFRFPDADPAAHLKAALKALRKRNAGGEDIYWRPGQGRDEDSIITYPYAFIDDVQSDTAETIRRTCRAALVHTSEEGGYQVMVRIDQSITRAERTKINKVLCERASGDPGATGGIQPMRAPGFRNHKRGGQWVNFSQPLAGTNALKVRDILCDSESAKPPASHRGGAKSPAAPRAVVPQEDLKTAIAAAAQGGDPSRSGADFRACLRLLRQGADPDALAAELEAASGRKGRHAAGYARLTIAAAMKVI